MKKVLIIICAIIFIAFPASAQDENAFLKNGELEQIIDDTGFEQIDGFLHENGAKMSFKELLSSFIKGENILASLVKYAKDMFLFEIKSSLKLLLYLMAAAVVFSFLNTFSDGILSNSAAEAANTACCMICAFILANVFLYLTDAARGVIYKLNSFVSISMPMLMGFIASLGAAGTAAAVNPIVVIGIEILSAAVNAFFIPLVFCVFVLAMFADFSKNVNIKAFLQMIKTVLKWSMGLVFTLFTGTLALYGNFAASADALAMRAAKYAISASLPVAGTLLCDNMSVFTYSCAVIKNAFGAVSIFVILFMLALPVIKIAAITICLNITAALVSAVTNEKITNLISETAEAGRYVLAVVCVVGAVFIFGIAIIINVSQLPA